MQREKESEIPWDEGTVNIAKGKRIGYLKQNTELDDDKTIWSEMLSVFSELVIMEKELRNLEDMMGRDNVLNNESAYKNIMEQYAVKSELFEKNGGYIIEAKIKTILNGMGFKDFSYDTKISNLSGGEKTRLSLAKLLLEEPDLLLLDEPTNHLDLPSKEILEKALSEFEGTIIFISHDRYFINRIATRVLELTPSGINNYYGNYDFYIENKQPEPSCVTLQKHRTKKQSKAKSSGTKQEIGSIELRIYELESEISILEEELDDPELYKDYELFQNKYKVIEEKKTELKQCYEAWDNCMA